MSCGSEVTLRVSTAAGGGELTVEERNLLSIAYKNVIGDRRAFWRIVSSIEQKEDGRGAAGHAAAACGYRGRVENELSNICAGILRLLDERLVPAAAAVDAKVFYLKMKGDYHRYLAEFKTGNERKDAADSTLSAYQAAQELPPTRAPHQRLGLALNFSVFYYEILTSPDLACSLAKQAFDEAILELDTLGEESYKDSGGTVPRAPAHHSDNCRGDNAEPDRGRIHCCTCKDGRRCAPELHGLQDRFTSGVRSGSGGLDQAAADWKNEMRIQLKLCMIDLFPVLEG